MQSQALYILLALLSAIIMGTIGVFAKYAALPAEQITFFRLLLGSLFLISFMFISGKKGDIFHKPSKRHLFNGLMLAGFMSFYVKAIEYTSMANVIMVIYLAPLLTAIVAHFVFRERLKLVNIIAIAVALTGFSLMSTAPSASEIPDAGQSKGLLFSVVAMLSYSGFMLINRKPSQASPYQSTLVQLSVGALCLLPLVIMEPVPIDAEQLAWLLAIGLIPGFLAILFAVKALQHLPAVTFGTLAYLEPVAVVFLAWWLFAESLTPIQLFGCSLIILAGIAQGGLSQSPRLRSKSTPSRY
ncbi:EamA family transporter [Shewanella canadensis]|uniref:EamA family transporter n=1 Tax=Shewanella canadensis TaxID=271096 RepID=A0A3S0IN48_9GAMM|nr:DMT family transporter [Shewanella canadensis]RTR38896.1 EamA family transporter [Shewanella canadensis]